MSHCVVIRICNVGGKITMPWNFLNMKQRISYSYTELLKDIANGIYHCKLKDTCKNILCLSVAASKDGKAVGQINASPETNIFPMIEDFGMRYFNLTVDHDQSCDCQNISSQLIQAPNAFEILMNSSREQSKESIEIKEPQTAKERLFNKLAVLLKDQGCVYKNTTCATNFVKPLCNALWYVDGHHGTLESETVNKLPKEFQIFKGFNCPEKSKHRKRSTNNMSSNKFSDLSISLKENLIAIQHLDSDAWTSFKESVQMMYKVMDDYISYLSQKNKKIKVVQNTPRSKLEEQTNVTVLNQNNDTIYFKLKNLNQALKSVDINTPVSVRENLPVGCTRQQVYEIMSTLKGKGLLSWWL